MSDTAHASIDVGSNTVRLLIAKPAQGTSGQPWQTVAYKHFITRLGQGLHKSGKLSQEGMQRTLVALKSFKSIIDMHQIAAEHIYAMATAAVREASNGQDFQHLVKSQTGIALNIIHGQLEARTSLLGAISVLHPETRQDMLLFDIGGGSTEFIRAQRGKIIDDTSCKLGVVRLVEAHLRSDPPSASDYMAMQKAARHHLDTVTTHWQETSPHIPRHMVGTAGTVTTLAAVQMNLLPYDPERINNHHIHHADYERLKNRLLSMDHQQRLSIPAIEQGRADLIIAGMAIIDVIMEKWGYDSFITVDAGLLEGGWLASYETEVK